MSLTVFILDHKRFPNILHHILPSLDTVACINQIIIAHSNTDYEKEKNEDFPLLKPNTIDITNRNGKQLIRIQDSELNDVYQCYRRWIWIERLAQQDLIANPCILTHDDDFVFAQGEIQRLLETWQQRKGLIICGDGGRSFSGSTYSFRQVNGPCNIAVGQSMIISISQVLQVTEIVRKCGIPPEILHEDDIVVSLILGEGDPVHYGIGMRKKHFPSRDARFHRPNHIALRIQSARYILSILKVSSSKPSCPPHSHSLSTIDDKLATSDPIDL